MDLQYNSAMILLSVFMGTMTELCGKGTGLYLDCGGDYKTA